MRGFSLLIILFAIAFSSPAGAYVAGENNWPDARTVFYVDIPGGDGLWDDAFETAMFRWNDTTNFEFRIVRDSYVDPCRDPNVSVAKNGVAFSDSMCGSDWSDEIAISMIWFISSSNEIVQTGVVFNRNEEWGVYSGPWWGDPYFGIDDFRRTATHELGHCLGLKHEDSVAALMHFQAGDIEYPTADDIAGVNFLYPLPALNPPDPSSDTAGGNRDNDGGGGGGGGGGGCFIAVVKGD